MALVRHVRPETVPLKIFGGPALTTNVLHRPLDVGFVSFHIQSTSFWKPKALDRGQQHRQGQEKTNRGSEAFDRRYHLTVTKPRKNVRWCQGPTFGISDTVTSAAGRQGQKAYFSPTLSAQYWMSLNVSLLSNGV